MKRILFILILFVIVLPISLHAQLEKVIVETYYISDDNDATDTTGGRLESGSVTYRIYIDMAPGYKLMSIYGDATHALKISSTSNFFNNTADGQTFAKDFHKIRYGENTVALDTWLTLGQTTSIAAKTYFGTLKAEDRDGSFVGGANNDGGSAGVESGLLTDTNPEAGIPITMEDGMDTMSIIPTGWISSGDLDALSGKADSTIFGSATVSSQFISNNAYLQNSGVSGVIPDSNQVLVAQLTTKGNISFQLNVVISDTNGTNIKYVATLADGESNNDNLKISPYLTYPLPCGCKDPQYLEYSPSYGCDAPDSCKTLVVFGCMDTAACNYDPTANFNISDLCCYPGFCNDRDLSVVCPSLNHERYRSSSFVLYPNPAQSTISLEIPDSDNNETRYELYDSFGKLILVKDEGIISGGVLEQLDLSSLAKGLYVIRLFNGATSTTQKFIRN